MNMMPEREWPVIIAVILTYNRKDLLERSLAAVMAQPRHCDPVLVVVSMPAGTARPRCYRNVTIPA